MFTEKDRFFTRLHHLHLQMSYINTQAIILAVTRPDNYLDEIGKLTTSLNDCIASVKALTESYQLLITSSGMSLDDFRFNMN